LDFGPSLSSGQQHGWQFPRAILSPEDSFYSFSSLISLQGLMFNVYRDCLMLNWDEIFEIFQRIQIQDENVGTEEVIPCRDYNNTFSYFKSLQWLLQV
jgi:hypothetical protein